MKYLVTIVLALFAASCTCLHGQSPQSSQGGGKLGPQPGGDCVVNFDPMTYSGPIFQVGRTFDADPDTAAPDNVQNALEISSTHYDLRVGAATGSQYAVATEDVVYEIIIFNLQGVNANGDPVTPTAILRQKNDPTNYHPFSVVPQTLGTPTVNGLVMMSRPETVSGQHYVRLFITKETKGVWLDVRED